MLTYLKIALRQKVTWSEEVGDENLGHRLLPLLYPSIKSLHVMDICGYPGILIYAFDDLDMWWLFDR